MNEPRIDYEAIQKRVKDRVNKRKELYIHGGVYAIVNVMVFILWLILRSVTTDTGGGFIQHLVVLAQSFPLPLLLMGAWGIGLAIHALTVYLETGVFEGMQEREMQREIARERARLYADEKPKRMRRDSAQLSDDGEIVTDEEDESLDEVTQKRRVR